MNLKTKTKTSFPKPLKLSEVDEVDESHMS